MDSQKWDFAKINDYEFRRVQFLLFCGKVINDERVTSLYSETLSTLPVEQPITICDTIYLVLTNYLTISINNFIYDIYDNNVFKMLLLDICIYF